MSDPDRVREPSMEEILASIRRIVSDDNHDSRSAADKAPAQADDVAGRPEPAEQPDMAARGEPADRAGEDEAMDVAEAAASVADAGGAEDDALAMADAEARQRIGTVLGDSLEEELAAGAAGFSGPGDEAAGEPIEEFAVAEASFEDVAEPGRDARSFLERTEEALDAEFKLQTAGEPEPQPRRDVAFGREEPAAMEEPAGREEDTRLLSSRSDASVASALAALENFVLSTHSHTLEDVVSGTLRPLLTDWLDANLPPLVERLVREEIERVSRGRR